MANIEVQHCLIFCNLNVIPQNSRVHRAPEGRKSSQKTAEENCFTEKWRRAGIWCIGIGIGGIGKNFLLRQRPGSKSPASCSPSHTLHTYHEQLLKLEVDKYPTTWYRLMTMACWLHLVPRLFHPKVVSLFPRALLFLHLVHPCY